VRATAIQNIVIGAALTIAAPAARAGAQTPSPDIPPLTLQSALDSARANSQALRTAVISAQLAAEDRVQARAALLPGVSGLLQYIYTQPNGTPSGIFVANDGPHVYNAWGTVHGDIFAPTHWAEYRAAAAAEAVARARADVAARGLVVAVVQNYYGVVAAARKASSAQQGLVEAQQFLQITQQQERGGEVARSDVVKAQIQVAQRERDAQDANLTLAKARLALAVLVFADFRDNFAVVDDLQQIPTLAPLEEVKAKATASSPELTAAQAAINQEAAGISAARSGYLPSVSFDYFYGINANQFATYDPEGHRLLGAAAQAQMTVPLWSWGAVQSKLRQAELRRRQAEGDLALTRRQLLANVTAFYGEAQTARAQVDSLRSSLDLATESLRLTLLRYQAGEVTVLEVVDAQTTLIQARGAYDDGLLRYRIALAALQTLTGTL
jgi:outer membrane protein